MAAAPDNLDHDTSALAALELKQQQEQQTAIRAPAEERLTGARPPVPLDDPSAALVQWKLSPVAELIFVTPQ
ncbi:hypothetical protein A5791_10320 [Mycobacterium sp. 852002-51163_SCH5372311]|uniref:hypothetical protein n=1 Tax=Mycobacterium sp. 852002-51163_SCH5372311 TaxID=1834097 RepID=UPI0007FC4F56|nr:hypothetical protein [Mycobacterium sp. 852002-51163_SCH5372311]OBF79870.1 hypothetical protein A5791_10320 [Mycobacterium sp. 852002-51163_SCH5372311]